MNKIPNREDHITFDHETYITRLEEYIQQREVYILIALRKADGNRRTAPVTQNEKMVNRGINESVNIMCRTLEIERENV